MIKQSFRDIHPPSILDTSSGDIIQEFFVPLLSRAVKYDRGVGFFSSGWLRIASQGMCKFAENGGSARWVTSPILDPNDWEAIQTGDAARCNDVLKAVLIKAVEDLRTALEHDTLSALSWMISDEVIKFKLAVPRNKLAGGEFHDKFGIFVDLEGNQISFNGSYNDSIQGTRNYESLKVFCSWDPAYALHVESDKDRFERLWSGADPNVTVYDLPDATRAQIVKLRDYTRPYQDPTETRRQRIFETATARFKKEPRIPGNIELRDYQKNAIESWFSNECKGLLEMATGTGKTITSLAASVRLFQEGLQLAIIIAVPFQHLVDQWCKEASDFGYSPILAYKSKKTWLRKLEERIQSYIHGDIKCLSVITTHTTFATEHFQELIYKIPGRKLLIADEVHHMGATKTRQFLSEEVEFRLALSATPDRWFDEEGTNELHRYFGETVFEYSLADAIGVTLTPYYYYPVLIDLTYNELEEYRSLSTRIAQIMYADRVDDREDHLTRLLVKRADLLNRAENKLDRISELVDKLPKIEHALFYCAPGQIDEVVRLLGWDKRLEIHRFTAREDTKTRQRLLSDFASGRLQALVAMHCLDEGVDVPSTRTAFILASSSNPRQFIQRRGRILRKAYGKDYAYIYDLITIPPPPDTFSEEANRAERSILKRELRRFVEFAQTARNTQEAYDVIWELANDYGILDF